MPITLPSPISHAFENPVILFEDSEVIIQKVGNIPIDGILGTNCETTTNSNGHKLKEFASVNELKTTNTFFRNNEIHKITWNAPRLQIHYRLHSKKQETITFSK